MSFMHFGATTAASAIGHVITLSGDNINAASAFSYQWGWSFKLDGSVEEYRDGFTSSGPASDWIDPKIGFTAADYEVRGGLQSEFCSQTKTNQQWKLQQQHQKPLVPRQLKNLRTNFEGNLFSQKIQRMTKPGSYITL